MTMPNIENPETVENKFSEDDRTKVKQHFDQAPYPDIPFSESGCRNFDHFYEWSIVNPFYRKYQRVINPQNKLILDVGCGSGVTTQKLVEANPGATLIGIDISPASIEVARSRFAHHGYKGHLFYAMSAEDLTDLGETFDYINCHETLYLLPSPLLGLQAMKSVLKSHGIIRANLHSHFQRSNFFRAQKLFRFLGLMEDSSLETGIQSVREIIEALNDSILLKQSWNHNNKTDEFITANFLLQGDKGFTIPETFELLRSVNLSFVSMIKWRFWDLLELFKDKNSIPEELAILLEISSEEEKLHLYEMIHPAYRLIDFWCCHDTAATVYQDPSTWDQNVWNNCIVHVNPILRYKETDPKPNLLELLTRSVYNSDPIDFSQILSVISPLKLTIFSNSALCLYLLIEQSRSFVELVNIWLQVKPIDPLTRQPVYQEEAIAQVRGILMSLEAASLVMIEPNFNL